jgi:signal transduction histidine kinase
MVAMTTDVVVGRVRIVAWIRALAATGAAIAACLLPPTSAHRVGLQVLAGLLWVPWSAGVALAATGRAPSWLPSVAAIGDLGIVFAGTLLLPTKGDVAALVYALEVVGSAWAGGLRLSLPVALAAIALPVVAGTVNGDASVDPLLLGVLALVVAAMVAVLERAAVVQRRSEVVSSRLAGKSAAVLDKVADAIVFCDGRGVIVEANAAAARLVHAPLETATHPACHDVLALHVGERRLDCSHGCPLVSDDDGGVRDDGVEAWRPAPDGGRQPLLVSVARVGDGNDVEVVHSLRDITRLKQADEAKTLFLATASHELKTPLTVIAGFSETLLLHDALDAHDREYALRAIDTRAHELSRIVDRLLLSSRIEAGRVDVEMSAVRVVPLVLERATALERAADRPVHVSVEVADDIAVAADPGAFVTVLDHLLDNAVKYSPDGGPVQLVVHAVGDIGDAVCVSVRDDGIGMDADAVDHCFDKFWQSHVGDRRRFGGTGIGLYIVKSLVEAMGGRVGVDSELGAGATFTVELRTAAPRDGTPDIVPTADAGERSMVREFMRQIGVGGGD